MKSIYDVVDRETASVRRKLRVGVIVSTRWQDGLNRYGRGCGGHDFFPHDLVEEGGTLRCMRCPWTETHAPLGGR